MAIYIASLSEFRSLQFLHCSLFIFILFHFPMVAYQQLTPGQKIAAQSLDKAGFSHSKIGKSLGVHQSTISRFFKRLKATGDAGQKKGSGRPRLSTARQDAGTTFTKRST
jgi:predicted ArsR family transcriptional regulator